MHLRAIDLAKGDYFWSKSSDAITATPIYTEIYFSNERKNLSPDDELAYLLGEYDELETLRSSQN